MPVPEAFTQWGGSMGVYQGIMTHTTQPIIRYRARTNTYNTTTDMVKPPERTSGSAA
jgi:hypothetical protein